MLKLSDLTARVASKCDDGDMTYVTPEYVMGLVPDVYDWLFGKLRLTGNQFDEQVVELPNVPAGTPNLDTFMSEDGVLGQLVQPRVIRSKLPGQSSIYYRLVDGPLDYPRDVQGDTAAYLDSWAWLRYSVKLANFSTALDLEVTGDFMFDPLTDPDSKVQMSLLANRVLSCKLASEVGKARGNDKWKIDYAADADDALDDLLIAMSKENQKKTHRFGRINRRGQNVGNTVTTR